MSQFELPRRRAFIQQAGKCFYCQRDMWEQSWENKQDARLRMDMMHVTKADFRKLMCTAEHLVRRADGGPAGRSNIVAACAECNSCRHETDPALYRQQRMVEVWGS